MQLAKFVTLAALAALALPASAQTVSQGVPRIDPTQEQPTKKGEKPSKKTDRARQDKQNEK